MTVRRFPKAGLEALIGHLRGEGYRVMGPVVRDGAVAFEAIERLADLPIGLRDEQEAGRYRLVPGPPGEVFGVVNGPGSLKPFFFAPEEPLLTVRRERRGLSAEPVTPPPERLAFLGVRACDLAALGVQDRIFLHGRYRDTHYARRREDVFVVAVHCTRAAPTCFCVSMGTGPEASGGFDLALTELDDVFLVQTGSPAGAAALAAVGGVTEADAESRAEADGRLAACAASMQRRLDTRGIRELLYANLEHPQWDDVARRCLACANCTMVCPTCFCHTVVDTAALGAAESTRVRRWDSCFSRDHAQIHGRNFRPHIRDRYRQWLTHKLATWIDQFGTSGCVGCGRCVTWCPVGIDLTAEVAAIRAAPAGGGAP